MRCMCAGVLRCCSLLRHMPLLPPFLLLLLLLLQVELVDRQLMSSLMGEWGMLQQLQGLVNAFLITSPSMVEWVEALFSVVETAKLCAPRSRGSGECSTPSPAASKAVSRIGGAGGAGCDSPGVFVGSPGVGAGASAAGQPLPVTVQDLDLCSLEALLQVGVWGCCWEGGLAAALCKHPSATICTVAGTRAG